MKVFLFAFFSFSFDLSGKWIGTMRSSSDEKISFMVRITNSNKYFQCLFTPNKNHAMIPQSTKLMEVIHDKTFVVYYPDNHDLEFGVVNLNKTGEHGIISGKSISFDGKWKMKTSISLNEQIKFTLKSKIELLWFEYTLTKSSEDSGMKQIYIFLICLFLLIFIISIPFLYNIIKRFRRNKKLL